MKTITEITLYDLMAEDLELWITPNKDFGINIEINNENGEPLMCALGIHPYAAKSFAVFCRKYLSGYENATKIEVV